MGPVSHVRSFFGGGTVGKTYSPHEPWVLQTYKSGGADHPKRIETFASQAAAAAELRKRIVEDDSKPEDFRWVYRIRHATSGWSLRSIFNEPMDRSEWAKIARIQWTMAMRARGYANRTRANRARGARRRGR